MVGLWEAGGIDQKSRWTQEDLIAVEEWQKEPRSISSKQLSQRLARERQVFLGAEQVRHYPYSEAICEPVYLAFDIGISFGSGIFKLD